MAAQNHTSTLFVLCLVSVWYDIFDPMLTFLQAGFYVGPCAHWIKENAHIDEEIKSKYSAWILMYDCVYVCTYVKKKKKER